LFKICVLASTSKGNSTFIRIKDTTFLIDAGISAREISKRIREIGEKVSDLSGIIISHEHNDHIKGIKALVKHNRIKCYLSDETFVKMKNKFRNIDIELIEIGKAFNLSSSSLEVIPYESSHDSIDPLVFRIDYNKIPLIGFITDCGFLNTYLIDGFRGVKILFIESNHSFDHLLRSTYPEFLKVRILGRKGHLSNWAAGEFIYEVKPQIAILGHISEENNSPEEALAEIETVLAAKERFNLPFLVVSSNSSRSPVIKGKL